MIFNLTFSELWNSASYNMYEKIKQVLFTLQLHCFLKMTSANVFYNVLSMLIHIGDRLMMDFSVDGGLVVVDMTCYRRN